MNLLGHPMDKPSPSVPVPLGEDWHGWNQSLGAGKGDCRKTLSRSGDSSLNLGDVNHCQSPFGKGGYRGIWLTTLGSKSPGFEYLQ